MRPPGSPKELERRRLRAIALLKKGHPPVEVARAVGVDRRSVRRWRAAYRRQGGRALKAVPAPGRPLKLGIEQRKELEEGLLRGAQQAGFATDLWTCPRVAKLIKMRFGITYHVDHVGRVLRSLGWSPQKPERRAKERDQEKIQRWIKQDWPRIRKKQSA
jgi:transposase